VTRNARKKLVTARGLRRCHRVEPDSEASLVERLRRGDPAAFDAIYDAYRPRIFAFLARMAGRRDVAEDLVQETFLRLAAHARSLAPDTRPGAWLFTVARNLHVSHCRSRALDAERLEWLAGQAPSAAGAPASSPTPFEEAAASELGARLERALAGLAPAQREVMLLIAVDRMEHDEAAAVLDLSREALRQRLSRARAQLAEALTRPPALARRTG
jgi:RNA polymerase sigma factor (sigma-70 family)